MASTITEASLPALHSDRIEQLLGTDCYNAYAIIHGAEHHATRRRDTISARVVGYFLLEFYERSGILGDMGWRALSKWVTSKPLERGDDEHDVVYRIGMLLHDNFIRLFRSCSSPYQTPPSHPSRSSFDLLRDMSKDALEITSKTHTSQRRQMLERDGQRCMITGILDRKLHRDCGDFERTMRKQPTASVQAAHILSEATFQGIDPEGTSKRTTTENKTEFTATVMAMLETFGFADLVETFRRPGGVHIPQNLLSLEPNLHMRFDDLDLWFECTPKENRYRIHVVDEGDEMYIHQNFVRPKPHVDGAPMVTDFTPSLDSGVPPPDPRLLALHSACARVFHISGVV